MQPRLTIIIPCYNSASTIEEAVTSCYVQGFSDKEFEIVMVDDGSTDTTRELLTKLTKQHANINVVFHEHNKGGGAARNTAVENAHAEVIFCLDSDDLLPEGTLLKLYDHLTRKNCDGVGVSRSLKFAGTNPNDVKNTHEFVRKNERIVLSDLFQRNGLCSLYSTFMFTKDAFTKAGGYPTTHGFDTQGFAWRFLAAGLYAETCPDTTYLHRIDYHESYYLREYSNGKVNYNWQAIFIENLQLFNTEAQRFITTFNCSDFTRSLIEELADKGVVFSKNPDQTALTTVPIRHARPVKRNSLLGIYYRLRSRVKKIVLHNQLLKSAILSVILTTQDIRPRLAAPHKVWLLYSYAILRIKKMTQHDFISSTTSDEVIDVVIPTLGKDIPLLEHYLEQLKKNLSTQIGTIYVVAPTIDSVSLKDFCSNNNLIFIDESTVLGYTPKAIDYEFDGIDRSGWLFQQLLKLSGEKFVTEKKYIITDSDTLLINPHNFREQDKDVFFETNEWNPHYFSSFERLFGYPAPHPLSLTSHMMIFDTSKIMEMKQEIEAKHGDSWDKAYINACNKKVSAGISDYDTYAQWMLYHYPSEVLTKPFYNRSFKQTKITEVMLNLAKYQRHNNSLSFHSYRE